MYAPVRLVSLSHTPRAGIKIYRVMTRVLRSQSVLPHGTSLEPFVERSALGHVHKLSGHDSFSTELPQMRDGAFRFTGACVILWSSACIGIVRVHQLLLSSTCPRPFFLRNSTICASRAMPAELLQEALMRWAGDVL